MSFRKVYLVKSRYEINAYKDTIILGVFINKKSAIKFLTDFTPPGIENKPNAEVILINDKKRIDFEEPNFKYSCVLSIEKFEVQNLKEESDE